MSVKRYIYGQMISVFLHMLDDKEKRAPYVIKIHDALRRVHHKPKHNMDATYYEAADILQRAMELSWIEIPDGKEVTINAICWLILSRHKDDLKHYKFNLKHFEKMSKVGVSGHAMQTAKVLNIIEKYIDKQLTEKDK